jgi:hypothetical protein
LEHVLTKAENEALTILKENKQKNGSNREGKSKPPCPMKSQVQTFNGSVQNQKYF